MADHHQLSNFIWQIADLLAEKGNAIITYAVTCGLNPSTPIRTIELLHERRAALITAAVSGQMRVEA